MGKNICILSMQKVNNYGSLLQAYSLKNIIEDLGFCVAFIDIEKRDNDNLLRGNNHHIFAEETQSSFLERIKKLDKYVLNRIVAKIYIHNQFKMYDDFREKYLGINEKNNYNKYDCCVIGSDEVFNCMSNSVWGFTSQLFGNVRQANKVISYAASCGATEFSQLPDKVRKKIKESFKRISGFSVRDSNTASFVKEVSGINSYINADPVVIGNFDSEIANAKLPSDLPNKYCIIYSYQNRISENSEIKEIQKLCKNNDMEIVSVGSPQCWIKKHIVCDPFQMLKVFSNAEFVFTDTFHGTIFSAKYAKRYAVIVRESNRNKLLDLLERLNIKEHCIDDIKELNKKYSLIDNGDNLQQIIEKERNKTVEYLKHNL